MLAEYKKQTNQWIGLAIVASLVYILIIIFWESEYALPTSKAIGMGTLLLYICGCCYYAKGKGYHGAWGLLGLLTIIGLIILICFPDRHKTVKRNPAPPIEGQNVSGDEGF